MSRMRVAICENCLIEPVHLTPEQAADLPTKTTPLRCARCKRSAEPTFQSGDAKDSHNWPTRD